MCNLKKNCPSVKDVQLKHNITLHSKMSNFKIHCPIYVKDVQLKNAFVLQGRRRDSLVSFEEDLSTTASDQLCTANIADGGGHVRFVDSTVRSDIFLFKEND